MRVFILGVCERGREGGERRGEEGGGGEGRGEEGRREEGRRVDLTLMSLHPLLVPLLFYIQGHSILVGESNAEHLVQ